MSFDWGAGSTRSAPIPLPPYALQMSSIALVVRAFAASRTLAVNPTTETALVRRDSINLAGAIH